jgi:hypothetical protein
VSKFKRCEIDGCPGVVSKSNPIIIRLHSADEGFGQFHAKPRGHGERCQCCGDIKIAKPRNIKIKICAICYHDLKDSFVKEINVDGLDREIVSFDDRRKVLLYNIKGMTIY